MPKLSPASQAIWEAFNEPGEVGVFVDYGNCLASAFRALATRINGADQIRQDILEIADELDTCQTESF
jgi:hypothetical protein